MNSLESFVQTRESFGAGTVHFHLQRKSGWTLAMECELVLSTGLSSALPMWVKIAYRSEFVQGEPVRCPGTILMLDSDLVDYLCYLRAEGPRPCTVLGTCMGLSFLGRSFFSLLG